MRADADATKRVVSHLSAALPCLWIGGKMLAVWIAPLAYEHGAWVQPVIMLFAFEMVIVGSGVFMAATALQVPPGRRRLPGLLGFALIFGIFAVAFSLTEGGQVVMRVYWAVILGRLISLVTLPADETRAATSRATQQAIVFLFVVLASVFIPAPALGLSPEVLDIVWPDRSMDAVWSAHPERALAAATLYFCGFGIHELSRIWRRP